MPHNQMMFKLMHQSSASSPACELPNYTGHIAELTPNAAGKTGDIKYHVQRKAGEHAALYAHSVVAKGARKDNMNGSTIYTCACQL